MNYKYGVEVFILKNDMESDYEYFIGRKDFITITEVENFIDIMNGIEQNNNEMFEYRIIIAETEN